MLLNPCHVIARPPSQQRLARNLASLEELREQATTFVAMLATDSRQMAGR